MNTKIIVLVIIVIAIVGGWLLLSGNEASAPTNEESPTSDASKQAPSPEQKDTEEINTTNNEATNTDTGKNSVVVRYTDGGFTPETIKISLGDAVVWKNESSRPMWVASAIHPTHTIYPEKSPNDCLGSSFDACKTIESGESWSFTFNSAGEWKYHDHVNAAMRGTVIVK